MWASASFWGFTCIKTYLGACQQNMNFYGQYTTVTTIGSVFSC